MTTGIHPLKFNKTFEFILVFNNKSISSHANKSIVSWAWLEFTCPGKLFLSFPLVAAQLDPNPPLLLTSSMWSEEERGAICTTES